MHLEKHGRKHLVAGKLAVTDPSMAGRNPGKGGARGCPAWMPTVVFGAPQAQPPRHAPSTRSVPMSGEKSPGKGRLQWNDLSSNAKAVPRPRSRLDGVVKTPTKGPKSRRCCPHEVAPEDKMLVMYSPTDSMSSTAASERDSAAFQPLPPALVDPSLQACPHPATPRALAPALGARRAGSFLRRLALARSRRKTRCL